MTGLLFLVLLLTAQPASSGPTDGVVPDSVRVMLTRLKQGATVTVRGASLSSTSVLPAFYERRGYRPVWIRRTVSELARAIGNSALEGLNPDDYHRAAVTEIERSGTSAASPGQHAGDDLLLTDALIRLGYHLLFGKVDPERFDPKWNMAKEIGDFDPVGLLEHGIAPDTLTRVLAGLAPHHAMYAGLRSELARYRAVAAAGGWLEIPAGEPLKIGMSDSGVTILRARLQAEGDLLPGPAVGAEVFDSSLAAAVRAFQSRHGLGVDGVVGNTTRRVMNRPLQQLIDQLRVNLDRMRLGLPVPDDRFVLVNVAGYALFYVENHQVRWTTRVQVGKAQRQTPMFRSLIDHIVFNPTWTVPPTILTDDYLPQLKRDPSALKQKHIRVLTAGGREVDPARVDWSRYPERPVPYILRQDPGPSNALGRVKFMFPNSDAIYLHDTPNKEGFGRPERTFSSGCIRVEHPLELARLLLADEANWNAETVSGAVAAGNTRTVRLREPVPVMLVYLTAWTGPDGVARFRGDVYGRDARFLEALDAEFSFRKRPIVSGQEGR